MNLIQELLNILDRKEDKKSLDLKRDWFEFGRTKPSSLGNPLYSPKMTPHAIRFDDLKCNIISGLVEGTGTEHTLPVWSTVDPSNCDVQTMVDSIFSQNVGATEGKVSGDFRVTGDTVLEGNLLVLGTQTIVESTIVEVADNIMRINSGGGAFDAGIEVIQPSGVKTWAWDNAKGLWSTFGESIITKDIVIEGSIRQDGEVLKNVVNEAEGLASQDNDESLATVAAIINYVDQERDYISNVTLTGTDLIFTGVNNAFSGTIDLSSFLDDTNLARIINGTLSGTDLVLTRDDATTITIDLSSIGNTTPVMTSTITGTGKLWDDAVQLVDALPVSEMIDRTYGVQFNPNRQLVVNVPWESGSVVVANPGGATVDLATILIDGVSYAIGASAPADGNDFISNVVFNAGTSELSFSGSGGAFSGVIDLSGLAGTTYTASNGIQLVTPTEFGLVDVTRTNSSNAIAPNHTDSFTVIDDITTNSKGQVTNVNVKTVTLPASGTGADGVITNVALSGTDLVFTGSNGGFNGTVSLSTLGADGNATYTLGLVASGVNDTVIKLTGANGGADSQFTLAGGTGISITENTSTNTVVIASTVTDTNDIDYVSNVALSGSSLDFTGIGNGFNGSVDLSSLSTVETLTTLSINANTLTYTDENGANTDIDLSLYLDDTNLARLVSGTLDGATGIATFSRDDASTFTVDFSSLIDVDTNDIDYVRTVALNGTSLDFTAVGNAFAGSIDLSSLSGTTYTAGTYLTLTGTAFNHDATTRSNTTSTASPAAGASFTVVDSVVTNATGHITGVNTKTVTLPDAVASSTVACVGGLTLSPGGALTATLSPIQDATSKLGFVSAAADRRHYNIVWTIEYATTGSTGVKQLITGVRVTPNGGSASTPITWNDSAYMVSEYRHTSTYSYSIANIQQGDMIEILVAGSTDVSVIKAHISGTIVECEAFGSGEVTIPPSESRGESPTPTSYTYYNVLNCASDTSGIMAVPTSITQPLVDGTQYRYTLNNATLINTPWDVEMMVRVQSIADPQTEDFTVTALTRDTCPLT